MKNIFKFSIQVLSLMIMAVGSCLAFGGSSIDPTNIVLAGMTVMVNPEGAHFQNFMDLLYNAPDQFKKYRINESANPLITQQDLRLECKIKAGKASLEFVVEDKDGQRNSEVRLKPGNLFWPTHISFGIQKETSVTNQENGKDIDEHVLFTYPDGNYFYGVSGSTREYRELQQIFNGKLKLTTGKVERISDFPMHSLLNTPEQQFLTPAANGMAHATFPTYGSTAAQRGFELLNIPFPLDGNVDNKITIEVARGFNPIATGLNDELAIACDNIGVIRLRGLLYQGDSVNGCKVV